jgi:hypothetical protein
MMMQRSTYPVEPELIRLCRSKSWSLVQERAFSHPQDATPSSSAKEGGGGSTALAIAIRHGAPLMAIQSLVEARRSQLGIIHRIRGCVLHEALRCQASLHVIRYLHQAVAQHEQKSLLGTLDELGRTPMHCLMLRAVQSTTDCPATLWILIRSVVLAFPVAIQTFDVDGNTPLLLLLLHHDPIRNRSSSSNDHIHRIVQLLVTLCPQAAIQQTSFQWHTKQSHDGGPTPLTFALFYSRCENIITTLLEASRKAGVNSCLTKITGYEETALHVAVTTRASHSLIEQLVCMEPASLFCKDNSGLTPMDWFWIRHVLDSRSSTPLIPLLASTRRFIPSDYIEWHKEALGRHSNLQCEQKAQFWQTMTLMVNAAVQTRTSSHDVKPSFLHAVCKIHCPLAVVLMVLEKNAGGVANKDSVGRLPLHEAASRSGYSIKVPLGISQAGQVIEEESPVHTLLQEFPEGARIADAQLQLPLHCAIEANSSSEVIEELLRYHPDALERRDGKTRLYPFMQANVVEAAFMLLQRDPTFCALAVNV